MGNLLSIVMPCHNKRPALEKTIESLCQQTCSPEVFELLLVDQASTDGSREYAYSFNSPFKLIVLEQDAKHGISIARNAGIAAASTQTILLLDADLIADPELLQSHINYIQRYPEALICGRVRPYLPAYSTYIERIANPEAGLDCGGEEGSLPFYNSFGGHMLFSKELFARIGPFDPELKGFEDIDFAYRATLQEIPILYNAKAVSYHNHTRTLTERFEQARSYNRMLPILIKRYPELKGNLPFIGNNAPIHWQRDRSQQVMNKIMARMFGLTAIQSISIAVLNILNRHHFLPVLVRFLYWKLLIANWYRGYQEGLSIINS